MASEPFEVTDDKGNTVTGTIDIFRDPLRFRIGDVLVSCYIGNKVRRRKSAPSIGSW